MRRACPASRLRRLAEGPGQHADEVPQKPFDAGLHMCGFFVSLYILSFSYSAYIGFGKGTSLISSCVAFS